MKSLISASIILYFVAPVSAQAVSWVETQPANAPTARWAHAMAYDQIRDRTLVFGGRQVGGAYLGDTWEYNGLDWEQRSPANAPSPRQHTAAVYDLVNDEIVLFGGRAQGNALLADTWTWDGVDWTLKTPATSPPARRDTTLAYDLARGRVVLFGGRIGAFTSAAQINDTWEWDGTNWLQIQTANSPSPRSTPLTYDITRGRIVLFSGTSANDTWEYDGVDWTQVNPLVSPPARNLHQLAYDLDRSRVVMYGGNDFSTQIDETWEYDGVTWTQRTPSVAPVARRQLNDGMVYDFRRKKIVLFGGISNNGYSNDTWEYGPSQVLTATPVSIAVATAGTQTFEVNAGLANASSGYFIVGSFSGTSPGTPLGPLLIPLVADSWSLQSLAVANSAAYPNTLGLLDASGRATAAFNMPANLPASFVGMTLSHACILFDGTGFTGVSNPVNLLFAQ